MIDRVESFGHVCGSIPIGKVLNENCQVKHVKNLRVVDASMMPKPISCPIYLYIILLLWFEKNEK